MFQKILLDLIVNDEEVKGLLDILYNIHFFKYDVCKNMWQLIIAAELV